MRRLLTPVLAVALVAAAALAATVAPAAGASGSASDDGDRVFYIVGGSSFGVLGEGEDGDDDPVTEDDITPIGEDDVDDVGEEEESPIQEALPSFPADSFGRFRLLQDAGLAPSASSYEEALADIELAFMFAGREQWVRNLAGGGVEGEPALWNVTMQSVLHEENALHLLLGRAALAAERGLFSDADDLAYWQSLVPSWAPRVRDALAKRGLPFSVELLASPEINLSDPTRPLFGKGETPLSLIGLGVLQKGENAFLRSLSAEELMLELWPSYYRYYHRPAGAPVPDELRAGLTFGSPVYLGGNQYLRSPVMSSDSYRRWLAYGYPGVLAIENPTTGAELGAAAFEAILEAEYRFTGDYELFAPDSMSSEVLDRYRTLAQGG